MNKTILFVVIVLAFAALFIAGCQNIPVNPNNQSANQTPSQDLKQFKDAAELQAFLAKAGQDSTSGNSGGIMVNKMSAERSTGALSAPVAQQATTPAGAADYSQTNNQYQSVDEADFVKNDGRYIYMIADNKLVIVDAANPENAGIISTTKIFDNDTGYGYDIPRAQELLLNKDKVVIFVNANEQSFTFQKYDITPVPTYRQKTYLYIYDVSDRKNPKLLDKYSVSGNYYQSRMINDVVYVIAQEYANYRTIDMPVVMLGAEKMLPPIYYFDNPEQNYVYNTILSVNLKTDAVVDSKSFLLGYGNTLMVSENNIYIAYQKQRYYCWGFRCYNEQYSKERFDNVIVPLLQGDLKTQITTINSMSITDDEKWDKISTVLTDFFSKAQNNEQLQEQYKDMFTKIQDALQEYDLRQELEHSKTVISKIAIADGHITYMSRAEVDGRLLNQYSLDEYNNNLRVATTVDVWLNSGRKEYNNVYVLGATMNTVGTLQDIAPNESIYSTRFMGNRLYMVTYRQIDPFFAIDLSDPSSPKILGQLKVPGYSSYLHPINDTTLIGVGKETDVNEYGSTVTKGVKISIFDVSDVARPKETGHYTIGISGTDSAVLHDPKAFLYSKTKNIVVLPVTEVIDTGRNGPYGYYYNVWNGAYVFSVKDSALELLGKVKHSSSNSQYFNWWNQATVTRSIYFDNSLYTISNQYIKVNDLTNNLTSQNSIDLPYQENAPYPMPMIY